MQRFYTTLLTGMLYATSTVQSQPNMLVAAGDTLKFTMPQVEIISEKEGVFQRTPGSLTQIPKKEIQLSNPLSGNEIFRKSPGLHVTDEEGAGLRTNIGIRGLDPDRSRSVLILEDGIPVSLNPYG